MMISFFWNIKTKAKTTSTGLAKKMKVLPMDDNYQWHTIEHDMVYHFKFIWGIGNAI